MSFITCEDITQFSSSFALKFDDKILATHFGSMKKNILIKGSWSAALVENVSHI